MVYAIHNKNLKFYLERGIQVTIAHRGIKFSTGDYLKVAAFLLIVQLSGLIYLLVSVRST